MNTTICQVVFFKANPDLEILCNQKRAVITIETNFECKGVLEFLMTPIYLAAGYMYFTPDLDLQKKNSPFCYSIK